MKPEEIPPIQMPGANVEQNHGRKYPSQHSVPVEQPTEKKPEIIKTPSPDRIRFNKLEATNSHSQEIAKQIRHVNQSMKTIASHLDKMRSSLEHIVKIYPPYPPGSTERIEALRQFSALRNMIDQMTLPNRDSGMANIISAADSPSDSANLNISAGEHRLQIDRQPLHSGKGGLNIPDISTQSSDQHISDALDKTIVAQATLQARRQSFVADANRIISELS